MNLTRELVALEDKRQEENLSNQKLFNKTKIAMIKTESLKKWVFLLTLKLCHSNDLAW